MKYFVLTAFLTLVFAFLPLCGTQAQTPPTYSIYGLGPNTTGLGISQDGTYVTGIYYSTNAGFSNPQPGFLWTQSGGAVTLPPAGGPGYVDVSPKAVNNSGLVGGTVSTTFYGTGALPVLYSNSSSATLLPLPAGTSVGSVYGINNAGAAVGSVSQNLNWYATVFTPTNATVLTQTTPNNGILQFGYGVC